MAGNGRFEGTASLLIRIPHLYKCGILVTSNGRASLT